MLNPRIQWKQERGVIVLSTDHQLKCESYFFRQLKADKKTFEIRNNDRDYKVGDWLILFDYNKTVGYTGLVIAHEVINVHQSKLLPDGFVILSIGHSEEAAEEYYKIAQLKRGTM
jgi:hypothetical protein